MISNSRYCVSFSIENVSTNGSYLNFEGLATNQVPFVIAENCNVTAWSISASQPQEGASISILQNGNSILTAEFNACQSNTENCLSLPFNQNDQISATISGLSGTVSVTISLFIETI